MIHAIPNSLAEAHNMSGRWAFWIVWLVAEIGLVGCHLGAIPIVPSPLAYQEQVAQVLKIVPMGTPRDDAIRKLTAAGLRGEFGVSPSIYYCDLWNREDGVRWQVNVALLFDERGRLYKLRPAQAETGVVSGGSRFVQESGSFPGNGRRDSNSLSQPSLKPMDAARFTGSNTESPASHPSILSDRNGRRTPFGEPVH